MVIASILIVNKQDPAQLRSPHWFPLRPLTFLVRGPGLVHLPGVSSLYDSYNLLGQTGRLWCFPHRMMLPAAFQSSRPSYILIPIRHLCLLPSNPNNTGRVGICCTRAFSYYCLIPNGNKIHRKTHP